MSVGHVQVGILGAGPAGLVLAELLRDAGIESVVLEARDRDYVQRRVRAGVLEQGSVDALAALGADARLRREGLVHHGFELLFGGRRLRIDMTELCGRAITVYGQQEVVKDLIERRLAAGAPLLFEATAHAVHGIESTAPSIAYAHGGEEHELRCDFVAACDGFHGIGRPTIDAHLRTYERVYPFAWLGVLAHARPANEELIYACTERGFALHSMRSPTISRLYLQVTPDESLDDWPDRRIWDELRARLRSDDGFAPTEGEIFERSVTPMRSFVCEPMQRGRLFLAGDAAHIVPPTGAKGMNLAIADVQNLAEALIAFYADGDRAPLDGYTERCLQRVWRAEHFSWLMTTMLHRPTDGDPFSERLQRSQLDYLAVSRPARMSLAENYAGMPRG